MARPVVALLTDFGVRDHYVGTMKGVVLSVCPEASLVDITHEIAPQDVFGGALELAASYRYFPPATVFLVVVDPGVGSTRRPIAAEAGGYHFVAPDNGVLSGVLQEAPPTLVVELTDRKYARSTISRTFEGRDRFAPAAGWLARGTELRLLGPRISNHATLHFPEVEISADSIRGVVVRIDRFGNAITNVDASVLSRIRAPRAVRVSSEPAIAVVDTYADVPAGEPCALVGSSGYLEVAVNGGSAAARLTLARGDAVTVLPL